MFIKERRHYDYATPEAPVIPALDIEEIFHKHHWDSKEGLTDADLSILSTGIYFLELARKGREIARSTVTSGELSTEIRPIRAFLLTSRAIMNSKDLDIEDTGELLDNTISLLRHLVHGSPPLPEAMSKTNIHRARELFLSLSLIPMSLFEPD